jgi:hypothetical protein
LSSAGQSNCRSIPYVFQSFWDFHSGKIDEAEWQKRFTVGKRRAHQALASGNTPELLGVVFNRIYTLRNQLIHGGPPGMAPSIVINYAIASNS